MHSFLTSATTPYTNRCRPLMKMNHTILIFLLFSFFCKAQQNSEPIEIYEKHKSKGNFYIGGDELELHENNRFVFRHMTHSLLNEDFGSWRRVDNYLTIKIDSTTGFIFGDGVIEFMVRKNKLIEIENGRRNGGWNLKRRK